MSSTSQVIRKALFDKAKRTFSEHDGQISISMDVLRYEKQWMSVDEYLCLRAHFIDDDWKLQEWVIKYCEVFGLEMLHPLTAAVESLKEWDIEGKIFTLTVGSTMDPSETVEEIQEKRELPLNGRLFHVKCCSDIISETVQIGFEMISKSILKIQGLAWSKSEPLWYLTSHKLRSAMELEALGEFSSVKDYDVPSKEEWGKVRSVCRIADRIYEITKELFKVERPTANLFLPHLQELRAYLAQEAASSDSFVMTLAQKMLNTYDEYWKDMYLVLAIAAFMDPRYKMQLVESFSSKVGDAVENAASVLETIRKLYDGYVVQNGQKEYLVSDLSSESVEEEEQDDDEEGSDMHTKNQSHNLLEKLNIPREFCSSLQTVSDQHQMSDLDLYLEEPILPWTQEFCVLSWWKDNCSKYPRLSRMARDFLAIPMSVATSYDAYYIEPREADRRVLSLKPELMNAVKCIRSWKLDNDKV